MKARSQGFTLIELVVVITILGILAAFAIPRFAGLETSARVASVNGLAGSIRAAAALAHSVALVSGTAAADPVTMEGQAVTMEEFYPTADNAGITSALQEGVEDSYDTTGDDGTFLLSSAPTPANCSVTYTAAPASGSPGVLVDTSDC
ncbi:MAG: prepilin-type N-terminal cleavage/methylation domain-containing protein [Gammaproteobacteria bacterium]|nr:prepilin-type N-terminal cleavage/methylation domain-containing protein [Gammaproteobacteria bacterium]